MEDMYIDNPKLGKCKIIAIFLDIAILEIKNNKYTCYALVNGLSIKTNTWENIFYYKDFSKALEVFGENLQDFYELRFRFF